MKSKKLSALILIATIVFSFSAVAVLEVFAAEGDSCTQANAVQTCGSADKCIERVGGVGSACAGASCRTPGSTTECGAGKICVGVSIVNNVSYCVASGDATAEGGSPTFPTRGQQGPAVGGGTDGQTLMNPLKVGSLEALLTLVIDAIIDIGLIILVLAIVWVGFLFVAAQGKEEKIREARGALLWTVVGGMLVLGAKVISEVIKATVNTL